MNNYWSLADTGRLSVNLTRVKRLPMFFKDIGFIWFGIDYGLWRWLGHWLDVQIIYYIIIYSLFKNNIIFNISGMLRIHFGEWEVILFSSYYLYTGI